MSPKTSLSVLLVCAISQSLSAGPPNPRAAGLDPEPLVAEAYGLKMHLPAGTTVTTQLTDQKLMYVFADGREVGAWGMRLQPLVSSRPGASAESLIQDKIREVRSTGRRFRIIANHPGIYGAVEGRLLYLQRTLPDGAEVINGWLILPTAPQRFLVFSLVMSADRFGLLRSVFDASFSTIDLRSQEEVAAQRQARLERGRMVIDTLTPARLRSLVSGRTLYRIYQPATSGRADDETEFGYFTMRFLEAPRGRLTPERLPSSYGAMESEEGLMVVIEARAIVDAAAKHYVDVEGRYWMGWTRSSEAWSVRVTERKGVTEHTTAETGVRARGVLNVIHSAREEFTRQPTEWSIPDKAYLSQPEVFGLGGLLPRDGTVTGPMTFYHYDSRLRRVPRRIDDWQPADDPTGHWVLRTRSSIAAGVVTQIFDARGTRLRRIDADGKITERIDHRELLRIWQAKGLLAR